MIVINDFFVRYKEAVSNQMELIAHRNNGRIISATRFMGQEALKEDDLKDDIYIYSPMIYVTKVIKEVLHSKEERIHVFEEEPCMWKRALFNLSNNPLYVSMYRRPNQKYAAHLKKYKNLQKVFVELEKHKEILIKYGIPKEKIYVTPTPAKIPRKKNDKEYNPDKVNILFASWNNKEGDAIRDRGLEYLLRLLQINKKFTLTIPIRDNDTQNFEKMARELCVWDRIELLDIHNNADKLIGLFDAADFVAFVPQKRIVKDVPNSLIDGIVRGKPVIVSNIIDFSEVVQEQNIGLVVNAGDKPEEMKVSVQEYQEMSRKAFEYSILHSEENYANIIENAYDGRKSNDFINGLCSSNYEIKEEEIVISGRGNENENSNNKSLGDIGEINPEEPKDL